MVDTIPHSQPAAVRSDRTLTVYQVRLEPIQPGLRVRDSLFGFRPNLGAIALLANFHHIRDTTPPCRVVREADSVHQR